MRNGAWTAILLTSLLQAGCSGAICDSRGEACASAGSGASPVELNPPLPDPVDQLDDDNTSSGFGGGTATGIQWSVASSWLELDAVGLAASNGTFSSRIIDSASAASTWTTLNWTPAEPYGKELPSTSETGYFLGNADMTSLQLLLHMNEASWSGVPGEVTDSSGLGGSAKAKGGATTSAAGRFSSAGAFDGSADAVRVEDSALLDLASSFSFEAWIKPSAAISSIGSRGTSGILDKGTYRLSFPSGSSKLRLEATSSAVPAWSASRASALDRSVFAFKEFNGELYAGIAHNTTAAQPDIAICTPGAATGPCTAWSAGPDVGGRGSVSAFAVFNDVLYAATNQDGAASTAAVFSCSPGTGGTATRCDAATDWTLSFDSGFIYVNSLAVFRGRLYAAIGNNTGNAGDVKVCKPELTGDASLCEAADWSVAFETGASIEQAIALSVFNDRLYVGLGISNNDAAIHVCDPALTGDATSCETADWTVSRPAGGLDSVWALVEHRGRLYAGFEEPSANNTYRLAGCKPELTGDLLVCDSGDWVAAFGNESGYDSVESLASYGGRLYAGLGWTSGTGEIRVCADPGLGGDAETCDTAAEWSTSRAAGVYNIVAGLHVFQGRLYAGLGGDNGEGDVDVLDAGRSIDSSTSTWTSAWHHVVSTHDGANLNLYVDGALESSVAAAGAIGTNDAPLMIGQLLGAPSDGSSASVHFNGLIDEVAVYGRTLALAEIQDRYRRGILNLKLQVRSCPDSVCATDLFAGPDGTGTSYFSELLNSLSSPPGAQSLALGPNRYFQYQATFTTENTIDSPRLRAVSVGPAH